MFDTYISPRPRTEYVTREIHEHRAPTDESVRLLVEMEKAAEDKLIASMTIDGNHFKGVVHIAKDMVSDRIVAKAIVDINGQRLVVDHDVSSSSGDPKTDLIVGLRGKLAHRIATDILVDCLRDVRF